jgi:hypothetical protein
VLSHRDGDWIMRFSYRGSVKRRRFVWHGLKVRARFSLHSRILSEAWIT